MKEVTTMRGVERVPQPLGPRVRVAREAARLSRADLAQRLGVQVKTIAAWERGERTPRASRLAMLAGVTNVSLAWLLEGRESEHQEAQGAAPLEALRTELAQLDGLLADARSILENARKRIDAIASRATHGDSDRP